MRGVSSLLFVLALLLSSTVFVADSNNVEGGCTTAAASEKFRLKPRTQHWSTQLLHGGGSCHHHLLLLHNSGHYHPYSNQIWNPHLLLNSSWYKYQSDFSHQMIIAIIIATRRRCSFSVFHQLGGWSRNRQSWRRAERSVCFSMSSSSSPPSSKSSSSSSQPQSPTWLCYQVSDHTTCHADES